jgi:hypothetical protein
MKWNESTLASLKPLNALFFNTVLRRPVDRTKSSLMEGTLLSIYTNMDVVLFVTLSQVIIMKRKNWSKRGVKGQGFNKGKLYHLNEW